MYQIRFYWRMIITSEEDINIVSRFEASNFASCRDTSCYIFGDLLKGKKAAARRLGNSTLSGMRTRLGWSRMPTTKIYSDSAIWCLCQVDKRVRLSLCLPQADSIRNRSQCQMWRWRTMDRWLAKQIWKSCFLRAPIPQDYRIGFNRKA
jgi:hypothetical protein